MGSNQKHSAEARRDRRAAIRLFAGVGASTILAFAPLVSAATQKLESDVLLRGECLELTVAGQNMTKTCSGVLDNRVLINGPVAFVFALSDIATVTFSGVGPQVQRGPDAVIQPVDRVTWRMFGAPSPHPLRAVGQCAYGNPYRGKARIVCEATTSEGKSRGEFLSDGTAPYARRD